MSEDDGSDRLSGDQVREMDGMEDWRSMHQALQARFLTGDFATGLEMVDRLGAAAEELGHHPDLDLRYGHLNVRLYSHDVFGKTERDVELARRISAIAGSARKPMARFVIVTPTWAPESWVDRLRRALRTPTAARSPELAARSTADRSTATKEYSAAPNTPHASMRATEIPSSSHSMAPIVACRADSPLGACGEP